MTAKFSIGDKVRFNHRAPAYIIGDARQRTRTIVDISPMSDGIGRHYYLAGRGKQLFNSWNYPFRSYQLEPAPHHAHNGRPRQKRRYNHNTKLLSAFQN